MNGSRGLQGPLWVTLLMVILLVSACAPAPTPAAPTPEAPQPPATVAKTAGQTGNIPSLDGRWEGSISVAGQEISARLNISGQGGTVDFPSQSALGIRIEKFVVEGYTVRFEVLPKPRTAMFSGEVQGDKMSGSFEQSGYKGTFTVTRATEEQAAPGEAKIYRVEDVTFNNGPYTLAGTLTIPQGGGPHPAVVLISGSGAQNRDEELFGFKLFAILADHLTKQGIAVLRYDDRGIGGSTTGTLDDTSETFADDVRTAVDYLKGRSEINSSQIGLLGHSEGGIIAPLVATQGTDIAFLVLMAGTGISGQKLLVEQAGAISLASGASVEKAKANAEEQQRAITAVLTGEGLDDVKTDFVEQSKAMAEQLPEDQRKALGDLDLWAAQIVDAQLAQLGGPWMRFFLTHDPALVLERVDAPVLALFGGKDTQVPAEMNVTAMKTALAKGANRDVTTTVFPEANHLFQVAGTGSPDEYATLKPEFVPGFLDTISQWILAHVK